MLTKEYASWNAASNSRIHTMVAVMDRPAGTLNSRTKTMASGVEPNSRNGRRRPQRVSTRSAVWPTMRSAMPAHTLVTP